MADLSLAATKDLLAELLSRYDAVIFTGYRDLNDKQFDVSTITKGSTIEVLGLGIFTESHLKTSVTEDDSE